MVFLRNITFTVGQLLLDSTENGIRFKYPDRSHFVDIPTNHVFNDTTEEDNKTCGYSVITELRDTYFWMSIEYGMTHPRRKDVLDIQTNEFSNNLRPAHHAELNKQAFLLYDFSSKYVYYSNSKFKINLLTILNKNIKNGHLFIKDFYKNITEFLKIIKEIKSISFTDVNELFNDGKNGKALKDLTGTDTPQKFTLIADYKTDLTTKLNNSIIPFIEKLDLAKKNNHLNNLVIRGIDTKGFEQIYNTEKFTTKVHVSCTLNEEENIFSIEEVKSKLIKKVINDTN